MTEYVCCLQEMHSWYKSTDISKGISEKVADTDCKSKMAGAAKLTDDKTKNITKKGHFIITKGRDSNYKRICT